MSRFQVYSRFHTYAEAAPLVQLLDRAGISFDVEHERNPLDKIYTGELSTLYPMISIKVIQSQFNKVNELVKSNVQLQLNDVNPDYYLFGFSDNELKQVLENPDEWNYFDQALATKLLMERTLAIPQPAHSLQELENTSYALSKETIIAGYALTFLFVFGGLVLGDGITSARRVLKNGERVKMFDDNACFHARVMIIIFITRALIAFLASYALYKEYSHPLNFMYPETPTL